MGFPHLREVDRWPVTPERARLALRTLSRDRRINMQLNTNSTKVQSVIEDPLVAYKLY